MLLEVIKWTVVLGIIASIYLIWKDGGDDDNFEEFGDN